MQSRKPGKWFQNSEAAAPEEAFVYAESKEGGSSSPQAEAEEAARKLQEEAQAKAATGQAIVDYACQFIGNP